MTLDFLMSFTAVRPFSDFLTTRTERAINSDMAASIRAVQRTFDSERRKR